jgi:hypothetical protein
MADKRFSELTEATTVADADILAISQSGTSKKLAASVLKDYAQQGLSVGVFPFYKANSISDPINLTADNKLPFTKSNGSASNIPLVV